mgnify:CR=1 FL=1
MVRAMRGYFAIGVERISKPGNIGTLVRTTHAFGGSFFFAIDPQPDMREMRFVDTSDAAIHMPLYVYDSVDTMALPKGCSLVGVELTDEAVELPSFRHPLRAAYVLGPERGSLSPELLERCAFTVKIPMKFCVNVGVAGGILMYDRMISLGRFAERPVRPGAPIDDTPTHTHGRPVLRSERKAHHRQRVRGTKGKATYESGVILPGEDEDDL